MKALRPVRMRRDRVDEILGRAGIHPAEFGKKLAVAVGAGASTGALLWGAPGALAGPPAVLLAATIWVRRRTSGRLERIEAAFPFAVRSMSSAVRAGINVQQAIAQAAREAPEPLNEELRQIVSEIELGIPIERALDEFADRCSIPGASVLATALSSAIRSGTDVAAVLDCILDSARDRRRLRRELRAATAQGRMTALVIGSLPFAFLLVMSAGAHRELHFLTREPAGWALLLAGLLLEIVGFAWMRRLEKVR